MKYLFFFLFVLTGIGCAPAATRIKFANPNGEVLILRSTGRQLSIECTFKKVAVGLHPDQVADRMARKALFKFFDVPAGKQLQIRGMTMAKEPVNDASYFIYFYVVKEADCRIQPEDHQ